MPQQQRADHYSRKKQAGLQISRHDYLSRLPAGRRDLVLRGVKFRPLCLFCPCGAVGSEDRKGSKINFIAETWLQSPSSATPNFSSFCCSADTTRSVPNIQSHQGKICP